MNKYNKFISPMRTWSFLTGIFLPFILFIVACQTQPFQIFIEVDGGRQALTTEATTVREALTQANITLEPLDRVKPDLYAQLAPGLIIVVTRIEEEIETERQVIPFERQTIVNEALATGETRLAQLGVNGEDEISIRVTYEDGQEVSRTEISRVTVIQPVPEILVIGPQGELPSTPIEGAVVYLSNGNAWLMRDSSGSRRPLTTAGDLDGRVFTLSPDGHQLLYTTSLTEAIDLPLNELWLASTTIVGEAPITVGIQGVLYAEWSPVVSSSLVAYSTAERTPNSPGWRANNDLWLISLPPTSTGGQRSRPKPTELLAPNTQGLYPWWGMNFTWSPDGQQLAYARADQIGVIDLTASNPDFTPLVDFPPLKTFSEWVWVPKISWSPDGKFIAAVVHGPPAASESAEESQVFDLWLFSVDGTFSVKVAEKVGMWANPSWSTTGIAFGEALNPLQSANSRYQVQLMDRDGSNKRQLFPYKEELGIQFPELAWASQGQTLLFIYNGNLYKLDDNGTPPQQLTTDGQASHIQWVSQASTLTNITSTVTITGAGIISPTEITSTSSTTSSDRLITPTVPVTRSITSTSFLTVTQTPSPNLIITEESPSIQLTSTVTSSASFKIEENKGNGGP